MNRNKSLLLAFLLVACNNTGFSGQSAKSPAKKTDPVPATADAKPTAPLKPAAKPAKPAVPSDSAPDALLPPPPAGSLAAFVSDATNKNPISGASVTIASLNVSCVTDAQGRCDLAGVADAALAVDASAAGYVAQTQQRAATEHEVRFVLSPELKDGETRLVLTWGEAPSDLDSHLFARRTDGTSDHVWFINTQGAGVDLDVDSIDGFGPETVTLRTLAPGHYDYKVLDYTHHADGSAPTSGGIADATALVRLYVKGQAPREFRPAAGKVGLVWNVLSFDIDAQGQITVQEGGAFSDDADSVMDHQGSSPN